MAFRKAALACAIASILAPVVPAGAQQPDQDQAAGTPEAQDRAQGAPAPRQTEPPVVVLDFDARGIRSGEEVLPELLGLAESPQLAELTLSPGDEPSASGSLVFEGLDAFETWRDEDAQAFFDAFGDGATIERTVRIRRGALAALAGRDGSVGLGGLERVSIDYSTEDNEATGDADIDAVTVLCGEGADCEPSN